MSSTLLHVAADRPGHFPDGAATVAQLSTPEPTSTRAGTDRQISGRVESGTTLSSAERSPRPDMALAPAHAAHWLSALVYAGPVVIVALLFLAARLDDRRRRADDALPAERGERGR